MQLHVHNGGMVTTGRHLWRKHPAVRSGDQLSLGERAADVLKKWFGTWTALFSVFGWLALWMTYQTAIKHNHGFDPYPWLLLNIILSCIAAVQGIILQISANRGDRINAEVALHTQRNTDALREQAGEILTLTQQQMSMLQGIEHANAELNLIRLAVVPGAPNPAAGTDPATVTITSAGDPPNATPGTGGGGSSTRVRYQPQPTSGPQQEGTTS